MIWVILLGLLLFLAFLMTADRFFNWQVALPRKPTFGQQMKAMAVEFFGKIALLIALCAIAFILWQAVAAGSR